MEPSGPSSPNPVRSDRGAAGKRQPAPSERRGFLVRLMATFVGGVVSFVPLASGLVVFFDPLRRKAGGRRWVRVTSLDSVGETPKSFPVVADRTDAWNRFPQEPIGAVYLRRAEDRVEAFNAICPHLGCFVGYNESSGHFECPCHDSKFSIDGTRIDPQTCPAPRNLDSLAVDDQAIIEGHVVVDFQDFRANVKEKEELPPS